MTAIWREDERGWRLLSPSGFPKEAILHDLVEQAPQVLPLAGSPQVVVLGREVRLGSGSADLVAVEPSGRPVLLEIKLASNAEARRAIVAQVLAYAAYLYGLSADSFGREVLGEHLRRRGLESVAGAFVRKYDLSGNRLWTRQFGSHADDWVYAVAADESGVYVAGFTAGALPGQGSAGGYDVFVRKFNPAGSVVWTSQFGTDAEDRGEGLAVDSSGVYVTGLTWGALPGQTSAGDMDAFVRKYDSTGAVLWTRQFGGNSWDWGHGVAASSSGVFVTGFTWGALPGQTSAGGADVFVRKYDSIGGEVWTRQWGSEPVGKADTGLEVSVDAQSGYVVGSTFGAWAGQVSSGDEDAFARQFGLGGEDGWTRQFGSVAPAAVILFVEGVGSSESCDTPTEEVVGLLDYVKGLPEFGDADFRLFSYAKGGANPTSDNSYPSCGWAAAYGWDRWPSYAQAATCGSIDNLQGASPVVGSSERFRSWYTAVSAGYSDVYVLGHSMGGVVVAYALATWPGGMPENLRAVVTLDSPLDGQPLAEAHAWFAACAMSADAYDDLDPSQGGTSASPVIGAIRGLRDTNSPLLQMVTAVGNNQDLAVWGIQSHLPGAWLNLRIDSDCLDTGFPGVGDHFCVFGDYRARLAVKTSLLHPAESGSRASHGVASWACAGQPADIVGSPRDDNLWLLDDDTMRGGRYRDVIVGLGGNDDIFGGGGDDLICGGPGNDNLYGQGGNDTLIGGIGFDSFWGGPGINTCDPTGLEPHTGC